MKKLFSAFLCLLLIMSMVSCNTDSPKGGDPYDDVIAKYKELLLCKKNNTDLPTPGEADPAFFGVLYAIAQMDLPPMEMGYAIKDINADGISELVLMRKNCQVYALFTLREGVPILVMDMTQGLSVIDPDGTVYLSTYVKDAESIMHVKKLVDGEMVGLEYGSYNASDTTSYYKIENGVRTEITKQEIVTLNDIYYSVMVSPTATTKAVGFYFIPAIKDEAQDACPLADFSSYDSILSVYKSIVSTYSEYTSYKWAEGEFDDIYRFANSTDYEIFHRIYYSGSMARPPQKMYSQEYATNGDNAYGYAKKDLNGDGIEELILMVDTFEIIAIFTMKDGKAILLDYPGYAEWIDGDGKIHLEKAIMIGGRYLAGAEYYLYQISDGAAVCEFGIGAGINGYLQKEGWYKIENGQQTLIPQEEWEELYAKYDVYPLHRDGNEYTKTYAGLDFIGLFDKTEPTVQKYTSLGRLDDSGVTVSDVSNNTVTFSMDYSKYDYDQMATIYETVITATATLQDGKYLFDNGTVKGSIEFGVNSVWVNIAESNHKDIDCRSYLFDYVAND